MKSTASRRHGFVLIEALVALLVVAFAALAISQVASLVMVSAGDAKARSEALAIAQAAVERARNNVIQSQYTGLTTSTENKTAGGTGSSLGPHTITTTVGTAGSLGQRTISSTVSWNSAAGTALSVTVNGLLSWDNADQGSIINDSITASAITPRGSARRGTSAMTHATAPTTNVTNNSDGTKIHNNTNSNRTELLAADGRTVILYLDYVNGVAQSFSTVSGRIYFDNGANNLPAVNTMMVRLSSEGECIYNNGTTTAVTAGSFSYNYFTYTCYMGSGWYGNVGIMSTDANANFTTCVGDPGYNSAQSNGTLTSPHPVQSAVRTYRGFELSGGNYLSTGMQAASAYPSTSTGYPKPAGLSYSGVTSGSSNDYFDNHFLVTKLTGNQTCASKMSSTTFARNAGAYYCITPDSASGTDQCSAVPIWPNFSGYVSGGGGGGGSTCTSNFYGSNAYTNGSPSITIAPSTYGSCSIQSGGIFSCNNISAPNGTSMTITSTRSGNNPARTTTVTATCSDVNNLVLN